MTNIEIAQEISSRIGTAPIPFESVYSVCLAIYQELGGTEEEFDDIYSILLEILPLAQYKTDYLSFKNVGNDTVYITCDNGTSYPVELGFYTLFQYSYDKINWYDLTEGTISLSINQKVYFRGKAVDSVNKTLSKCPIFKVYADNEKTTTVTTGCIEAGGDLNSMIDYEGNNSVVPVYGFGRLFRNCQALLTAPKMTVYKVKTSGCRQMFNGCSNLKNTPELTALDLGDSEYAYYAMFQGCTSLTTAPALPATRLGKKCYQQMFQDCINLTTAPELPATSVPASAYQRMFYGCTSLVIPPLTLPAPRIGSNAYTTMFCGCTSLTYSPDILLIDASIINYEPYTELPISMQPCMEMFKNCSSLREIRCFVKHIEDTGAAVSIFHNWVNGVAATGTFYIAAGTRSIWDDGVDGIPSGWTVIEI